MICPEPDCGCVCEPVLDWYGKAGHRVLKQNHYKGRPVWYCPECDSSFAANEPSYDDYHGKAAAGGDRDEGW